MTNKPTMVSEAVAAVRDWIAKPIAAVSAVVGVVAHLFQFGPVDAIAATAWAHAGMLFTATSVASETLAATLPYVSTSQMMTAGQVFGVLFLAKIGATVADSLEDQLDKDND